MTVVISVRRSQCPPVGAPFYEPLINPRAISFTGESRRLGVATFCIKRPLLIDGFSGSGALHSGLWRAAGGSGERVLGKTFELRTHQWLYPGDVQWIWETTAAAAHKLGARAPNPRNWYKSSMWVRKYSDKSLFYLRRTVSNNKSAFDKKKKKTTSTNCFKLCNRL